MGISLLIPDAKCLIAVTSMLSCMEQARLMILFHWIMAVFYITCASGETNFSRRQDWSNESVLYIKGQAPHQSAHHTPSI